ncbi:extracellular solute-binding protein [Candidatus Dojkabacteria bacterium]|nr:extracellular solute-binding protein [Candidatus Dojkabacteria bacterium]
MNNNNMRTIVIILAVVLVLLLLGVGGYYLLTGSGDGGDDTPLDNTGVVPTDRQVTLIWWNLFESQENVQPLIDAYQAKYPNISIEYSEKTLDEYQTSLEKVLTDGQPETTPDIFTVNAKSVARYKNYTLTAPSEVIDYATYQRNFYPVVAEDGAYDGTVHALPLGVDSIALIYNKKLLNDAGYTVPSDDWSELFEQAKNITKTTGNGGTSGQAISTSGLALGAADDDAQFWLEVINLLLLQSEVTMLDETDQAAFADDEATNEAAAYFGGYTDENVWDESLKRDIALFLEGKLGMFFAPSWRLDEIIQYNETYELGLDVGVANVPQLSSLEDESVGWADYWMQMVALDSQNHQVAWDFLNFASQPEQLRATYSKAAESRVFGQIYPRVDMKPELESNQYLEVYLDEVSHAESWKMVDYSQVKDAFKEWLASGGGNAGSAESQVTSIVDSNGYLRSSSIN